MLTLAYTRRGTLAHRFYPGPPSIHLSDLSCQYCKWRPSGVCGMFYLRVARPALARTHTYTKHSGLLSFASTTLILSLVNAQSTGVVTPNVVVGMALFVGGLAQLLAGMWEFAAGNTFGATGEWLAGSSPSSFLRYSYSTRP